ncbi:MAG: O-antigen ligase family protein [Acidaminococcaceae bacterium]|nr:O-antigen ligase family protein [Acidaminococcaceae bacterium]
MKSIRKKCSEERLIRFSRGRKVIDLPYPEDRKLVKYMAFFIGLMICVLRISTAAMQSACGIATLLGLILWYKNKDSLAISEEIQGYLKAYGVFLLSLLPSVIFSDNPAASAKEFANLWIWRFVVFVLIVAFIKQREYLVNMLTGVLTVISVECLFTLVEVLKHTRLDGRGAGFDRLVLPLGGIMCMMLPVVLVILMDSRFEKKLKKAASFSTISILVGLLCNKSRGAWLTELVVVPIAPLQYLKQKKKRLLAVVAVFLGILGFMLSSPHYVQRIQSITNTTTDRSNADRIWSWKSAEKMIRDHPVTGVGVERFQKHYQKYRFKQEKQNLGHTHNNFIHIATESGITGLAGLICFQGFWLYTSFRNYRKNKNPYDILIFTTCLGYICIFGQIDYTLGISDGMRIMWFLLAVLLQLKETEKLCQSGPAEIKQHIF